MRNPTSYRHIICISVSHTFSTTCSLLYEQAKSICSITNHDLLASLEKCLALLSGTVLGRLYIKYSDRLCLSRFSYVDWASYPDDHRSIASYYVYFCDNLFSESSKKQYIVPKTSSESEYGL